jgi:hypothetical protein
LPCYETKALPAALGIFIPKAPNPDTPILVTDAKGRILGANPMAERLVGRIPRDLGLLGGDYLRCLFALEPGGCGRTDHCNTCSLQMAVQAAAAGNTVSRLPVFLRQETTYLKLTISTTEARGLVMVTVHRVDPLPLAMATLKPFIESIPTGAAAAQATLNGNTIRDEAEE